MMDYLIDGSREGVANYITKEDYLADISLTFISPSRE